MPIFIHVTCPCGNQVMQDTFEDLTQTLENLKKLYQECSDKPYCPECEEWQKENRQLM